MKNTIYFAIGLFYAFMTFFIPVMFFAVTNPSKENLFLSCLLSCISGLASFNYFYSITKK